MPWIKLLKGRDSRSALRCDTRVNRLRRHEARAIQVLHYWIAGIWQAAQGDIQAGDTRRNKRFDDLAQRLIGPFIYQFHCFLRGDRQLPSLRRTPWTRPSW